jgi:hypothetical protein
LPAEAKKPTAGNENFVKNNPKKITHAKRDHNSRKTKTQFTQNFSTIHAGWKKSPGMPAAGKKSYERRATSRKLQAASQEPESQF